MPNSYDKEGHETSHKGTSFHYDGPERRCSDCPVKEVVVEKNNVVWIRIIGGAILLALGWAYIDLRTGMNDTSRQVSALSIKVAEIGTALDGAKSYQATNAEMLGYLRTRIDSLAFAEKEKLR